MAKHVFYPPIELVDHVIAYADGLKHHATDFGAVPESSPKDLEPLVKSAKALEPLSSEIAHLEVQLAAKLEQYHKAAAPLWTGFSEKLGYARLFAEKHDKTALLSFIRNYQHHTRGHGAAKAAGAVPALAAAPGAPVK